ncbi:uncharacterized protein [Periplaneta americana]|uniref:uncharacterized protein n=1 Tax=Periplaneta americana TaxID=6978 RepID=UPI0037E74E22
MEWLSIYSFSFSCRIWYASRTFRQIILNTEHRSSRYRRNIKNEENSLSHHPHTSAMSCPTKQAKDAGQGAGHSSTTAKTSITVYEPTGKAGRVNVTDCNRETLRKIIAELGSHMSMPQFVGLVSPHTCDRGSILRKVMGEEQVSFRDTVERMFAARNTDVGDLLAREQAQLKDRYDMWQQRMLSRQAQCEALLREVMPDFDWNKFNNDPFYLDKIFSGVSQKEDVSETQAEKNFKDWRHQMLNKLSFVRNQTKDLQRDNEMLMNQLQELRRNHHERQTMDTLNEQMQHEKNSDLYSKLQQLRKRREEQQQEIDRLFQQIESCQCPRNDDSF